MFPYFTQNNSLNPHQSLPEADYYFLSSRDRRGNRLRRIKSQDFPGGPVAKALRSQREGKTIPARGTRSQHVAQLRACTPQLACHKSQLRDMSRLGTARFKNKKNQVTCSR